LLSEEVIERYKEAGRIASEVRVRAVGMVKVGVPAIEVCERVEQMIRERGGEPAFPCNICINEVAAHYSSPPGDRTVIPPGSIVKVDLGVHVEGYIADTAVSICLDAKYEPLARASHEALEAALSMLRPGVTTRDLGRAIQSTIERWGFKPIWNLTGHQMERYKLHTGKTIPNVPRFSTETLKEGDVCAIEPFATLSTGAGEITQGRESYIFRLHRMRPPRGRAARSLFELAQNMFRTLPFSQRWLQGFLPEAEFSSAFRELLRSRRFSGYPVLVEKRGAPVSQTEHTAIVTEDGCLVTTR